VGSDDKGDQCRVLKATGVENDAAFITFESYY